MSIPATPELLGTLRASIALRLQTIPGLTVYPWPATGAYLQVAAGGAITIGLPTHRFLDDPRAADVRVGGWLWESSWPLTLYVVMTADASSTERVDEVLGRMVTAVRADYALGQNVTAAGITEADADLNDEDASVRMHVVSLELVTVCEMTS